MVKIRKRPPDEVADAVAQNIDRETERELARWAIRAGLGAAFINQNPGMELTPREMGLLISIRFDPAKDAAHDSLLRTLNEWSDE